MQVGVSTACAQLGRAPGELLPPPALIEILERGGVGFVELAGLPGDYFAALRPFLEARRTSLPVLVIDNVFPVSRAEAAELASLDRSEARAAVQAAQSTVRLAAELGARFVLLSLGAVTGARGRWATVRRAFLRGELEDAPAPLERLRRERNAHAARHLDAARRSLDTLAAVADRSGVVLGLRNPHPIGLPAPLELRMLRDDLAGAPLVPALDAPAAHLVDALGLVPLADTLAAWQGAPVAHLADACGPVAGLPPGRGELDVPAAARALGEGALAVFEPNVGLVEAEVLQAVATLRSLRT